MGCRTCEGMVVENEDMKTKILCGGIFIHLHIFIRRPTDHWYLEVCNAYDILSDNKCSNIYFPRPPPREERLPLCSILLDLLSY